MKLTTRQRLICERVVNVFETGHVDGRYGAISIYDDGPFGARQITYGRSQTTEYGNLSTLVRMYVAAGGIYSSELSPYVELIGRVALVDNNTFKDLLRRAGVEDPIMWATQDTFFDLIYFEPARKWAESNGFTLGLSMLVIYDSFIHSGSILALLRSRFGEVTPKKGGDERTWIAQYVDVRNKWLLTHRKAAIRNSSYRTRDFLREIKRGNWNLSMLPFVANGTPVDDHVRGKSKPALRALPKTLPDALVPFLGEFEDADVVVAMSEDSQVASAAIDSPVGAMLYIATGKSGILRDLASEAGVRPAMERLLTYRDRFRPDSDPRYWAVVNFDLHSSVPRLIIFDRIAGTFSRHLCAHGKGSDPDHSGMASIFSNADGSNCSSLGIHHCDVTYAGEHGRSLYLDGLERSNSAARARHIVMHGANYVSQDWIRDHSKIGRSLGCPAIEMGQVDHIIPKLMGGSLLIHWSLRGA